MTPKGIDMPIQITILGLGQIGSSIGLALSNREDDFLRVGFDKELNVAQAAKKKGAVDRNSNNLHRAVQEADIVVLALPIDQIRETLSVIRDTLKPNVVVLDTAPAKAALLAWVEELLPENCHYIGLTPVINPNYLHGLETGVDAARMDLFEGGLMGIAAPGDSSSEAFQLAIDLTKILGAEPLFIDIAEVDSFMAATHVLPQLLASTMLNITLDRPGWKDGLKFAGRAYAQITSPTAYLDLPEAVISACLENREHLLRHLDDLTTELTTARALIAAGDEQALLERYGDLRNAREKWLGARGRLDPLAGQRLPAKIPSTSQMFSRMIFGERKRRGPKKDE
jgi:prephenate dehydrogenase